MLPAVQREQPQAESAGLPIHQPQGLRHEDHRAEAGVLGRLVVGLSWKLPTVGMSVRAQRATDC